MAVVVVLAVVDVNVAVIVVAAVVVVVCLSSVSKFSNDWVQICSCHHRTKFSISRNYFAAKLETNENFSDQFWSHFENLCLTPIIQVCAVLPLPEVTNLNPATSSASF